MRKTAGCLVWPMLIKALNCLPGRIEVSRGFAGAMKGSFKMTENNLKAKRLLAHMHVEDLMEHFELDKETALRVESRIESWLEKLERGGEN